MTTGRDTKPGVHVACFGKHPAWSDHIENLGEVTGVLSKLEGDLYLSGIGNLITSGEWPSASSNHPYARARRRFVWQQGGDVVFAWTWPSADKVRRDHYPMLACVHVVGCDVFSVSRRLDPLFAPLIEALSAASTQDAVVALVAGFQRDCLAEISAAESNPIESYSKAAVRLHAGTALDSKGWQRLAYFLSTQYREIGIGSEASKLRSNTQFEGVRIPLDPTQPPAEALVHWLAWFRSQLVPDVPLFLCATEGESWCDMLAGPLTSEGLRALVSSAAQVHPVTQVPYEISPEFSGQVEGAMADLAKPWGESGRRTVFGVASPRFKPVMPLARPGGTAVEVTGKKDRDSARSAPVPETREPASNTPRNRYLVMALAAVCVAGVGLAIVALMPTSQSRGPAKSNEVAATPPTPVANSGLDGRWLSYWTQYDALKDVVLITPAGSYWTRRVGEIMSNARLDRAKWDPWTVVFGEKPAGTERETIAPHLFKNREEPLARGSLAADQLMAVARTEFPKWLQDGVRGLESTVAKGMVPGLLERHSQVNGTNQWAQSVRQWVQVESDLVAVQGSLAEWSSAWQRVVPVSLGYATNLTRAGVESIQLLRSPGEVQTNLSRFSKELVFAAAAVEKDLPATDRDYLLAALSEASKTSLTIQGWTQAVAQSKRLIPAETVAELGRLLADPEHRKRLDWIQKYRKQAGDELSKQFVEAQKGYEGLRNLPMVQANSAKVAEFNTLKVTAEKLKVRIHDQWAQLTTCDALVDSFKDSPPTRELMGFWGKWLAGAKAPLCQGAGKDDLKRLEVLRLTLEGAQGWMKRFSELPGFNAISQSPWPNRLTQSEWTEMIWEEAVRLGMGGKAFEVSLSPEEVSKAVGASIEKFKKAEASVATLKKSWSEGKWGDTAAVRTVLKENLGSKLFAGVAGKLGLLEMQRVIETTWGQTALVQVPKQPMELSMACERWGGDSNWPRTDAEWQMACAMAKAAKELKWEAVTQKKWFETQWRKRLGPGIVATQLGTIVDPVTQAGLGSWLPNAFKIHQDLAEISRRVANKELAEAKAKASEILKSPDVDPKLAEVVRRIQDSKTSTDPFENTDWVELQARLGASVTVAPDFAKKELQLDYGAGCQVRLKYSPSLPGVFVAITEVSAEQFAAWVNQPQAGAFKNAWIGSKAGERPIVRGTAREEKLLENPFSIWNNVGVVWRDGGYAASATLKRFPPNSTFARFGKFMEGIGESSASLPANCLSAVNAQRLAESMKCRLPTLQEWRELDKTTQAGTPMARPKTARKLSEDAFLAFDVAPVDILSCESKQEDTPGSGGPSFFQPVTTASGERGGYYQVHGNVAEYLFTPPSEYHLAGGSMACPGTDAVGLKDPNRAYVDAGLRLVLDRKEEDVLAQALRACGEMIARAPTP